AFPGEQRATPRPGQHPLGAPVKFGLIAQMQAPKPWPTGENVDHRIHWDTLAEAVLAEEVGFDYYWATEHHFYEEIAHSSAPEIFLAALATRTTPIRLGHGVVVLPCNHPVRVAERAATLDILSNGRLELGTGRGASWYHTEAFGVPIAESRDVWDEAMRVICALFVNETFPAHKGPHYEIPQRKLVPKPLQKPHPPLWVAGTSQSTFASAARAGLGVLGFTALPPARPAAAGAASRAARAAGARGGGVPRGAGGGRAGHLLRRDAQLPGGRVPHRLLRHGRSPRAGHRRRRDTLVPRRQRGPAQPRAVSARLRPQPVRAV